MRIVPLQGRSGRARFTVVDDADFDWVASGRWQYSTDGSKTGYAGARGRWLHRRLLERRGHDLTALFVDHCNGWALDNRGINLRTLTRAEKTKYSRKRNIHRIGKRWCVQLGQKVIGRYDTAVEAAESYEAGARAAGYFTQQQRAELLAPMIAQLDAWVIEGLLVRHVTNAPLIEDRYRLKVGN